jgi:hypothetical protein
VAQAVTIDMLGPRRSYSMETKPLAMLLIIMAMVKGDTREGPRSAALLLHALEAPDAAADHHPETLVIYRLKINPGVGQRCLGGRHRELRKAIGATRILGRAEILGRIKTGDLAGDLAIIRRRVERLVFGHATPTFGQVFPEGIQVAANRADYADSGDHYSALAHSNYAWA